MGQTCEATSSTNELQCVTTYCNDPLPVPYARILGNMNHVGAKRRYFCHGASISLENGDDIIECLNNGSWSTLGVQCLPYSSPIEGQYLLKHVVIPTVREYEGQTLSSCVALCDADTTYCMAFNYYPGNGSCILTANTVLDKFTVSLPGWRIYKKIFPVILTFPSDRDSYTLTKAEAIQHCINISSQIATLSDLTVANNMGYSRCRCGWVGNHPKAVISMTVNNDACIGVGVKECVFREDNRYDAFCKNKDYNYT